MNDRLKELIDKYETVGDFTHASLHNEAIDEAEKILGFKINPEFIEFLSEYGHGGIGGIEVFGVGMNNEMLFVTETLKYREYGLPQTLLVIENCDEWVYCIDSNNGKVVTWSNDEIQEAYESFDDYLFDRFSDAAENM